jgi:hypothetical protein
LLQIETSSSITKAAPKPEKEGNVTPVVKKEQVVRKKRVAKQEQAPLKQVETQSATKKE